MATVKLIEHKKSITTFNLVQQAAPKTSGAAVVCQLDAYCIPMLNENTKQDYMLKLAKHF